MKVNTLIDLLNKFDKHSEICITFHTNDGSTQYQSLDINDITEVDEVQQFIGSDDVEGCGKIISINV